MIVARAKALGLTKSRFVALVVERWSRSGAKAVSEADEALMGHSRQTKKARKA